MGRFVARNDKTAAVDEKLGEVPLDVGLRGVVWIGFAHHFVHPSADVRVEVEPLETLLALEEGEEGSGIWAVHFHLVKLRKCDVEACCANLMDFLGRTRGLLAKLVAGRCIAV